jgi:hypothetical protein
MDETIFSVEEFLTTSKEPDEFQELIYDDVNFIKFSYDDEPEDTYYPVSQEDIVTIIPLYDLRLNDLSEGEGILAIRKENGETVRVNEQGQVFEV